MEANYPALKRPRRKLCYLPNKKSTCSQWVKTLGLDDIDKMFKNFEESSHEEEEDDDQLPPTPLLQISETETIQNEREPSPVSQQEGQPTENLPNGQMGPEKDVVPPAARSPSLKLDMDLEDPFTADGPIKTSSPIVENMMAEAVEEVDNEKDRVVSPLLLACEDEGKEDAIKESPSTQKPQFNGHITEQSDDSEFESPPCKVTLSKAKVSSHQNKAEDSSKESQPVKENASNKSQTAVLESKRKAQRKENSEPPVLAATLEPKALVPTKKSESAQRQPSAETSTRVGSDMSTFLQRLRDATQPKPSCSRKFLSSVKPPPPPPEPEDDFLILEDDPPLWFNIPRKSATSKRQDRTSSNNTESSTEKVAKDITAETEQKQGESEQERQTGNQKTKQKKVKEKKNEVTEPGNDMDELCSPEDPPTADLMGQENPNKKEQLKEATSTESNEAEEQPKDTASRETDEDKPTRRKAKKTKKSSDTKSSESVSGGKKREENTKTSRATSSRGGRKATKGSGTVKETVHEEAVRRQRSEEPAEPEDLTSSPDKEVMNFEAQTEKEDKQNRPPAVSAGSLSEDDQIVGRRKRRQPSQWWLSCPQSTEEPKVPDNQLTQKKSKKSNKEPVATVTSPAKNNKDGNLKRRKQTETVLPSSQRTNKAKEKKTSKINIKRNPRGNTPNKIKALGEGFDEEEQEVLDQDLDPAHSSPLVFAQRDLSHNSGDQIFQRVYHHLPKEKLSITPVPVSPRGSTEQLRAAEPEKRRRRPASNWWMVNGQSEDVESSSSQTQEQEPKPRKERKKQPQLTRSRLGTPKHGNTVVSSKPLGGAPVPSLKEMPVLAPKNVKRSLATFKDIFTSATATPAKVSNKDTSQTKRRKVTARPAVEVTVTDCSTPSHKDCEVILSMDAAETNSALNHDTPQDSKLKGLRSGPSSMIELEEYEENDDQILPSNKSKAGLCMSDLCAPPLRPLALQPKDKANLTEWFKSLWSTNNDNGPEISPDHFDWYFYQGRAIGFLVDLDCGSFCSGKILLGSYMKKPLWVDHSATTVFNISTSSVSVTINGSESCLSPGKSFMVPCGHAYSIKNITAQPAVLYFTRMLAESSD